jgi:hypothetical protein
LPTLDQTGQRKLNGLSTTPGRVELLAGLEINAHVVDLDNGAGQCFVTLPHNNIFDHHFGGFRSHLGLNLGLGGVHALFLSWGGRDSQVADVVSRCAVAKNARPSNESVGAVTPGYGECLRRNSTVYLHQRSEPVLMRYDRNASTFGIMSRKNA